MKNTLTIDFNLNDSSRKDNYFFFLYFYFYLINKTKRVSNENIQSQILQLKEEQKKKVEKREKNINKYSVHTNKMNS